MRFTAIAALGMAALLTACGAVGGPSDSVLEELAKKGVAAGSLGPEWQAVASTASYSKTGMCNTQAEPDTHVCMIEITAKLPGQSSETKQTVVVKAKQTTDGGWSAVD